MKQFRAWRERCPVNAAVSELVADACAGLAGPSVGPPRCVVKGSHSALCAVGLLERQPLRMDPGQLER